MDKKFYFIPGLLILGLLIASLFYIKNIVRDLTLELKQLNAKIIEEQDSIHILKAEYSYLATPARIKKIVQLHLKLQPIKPKQVLEFKDLPKYLQENIIIERNP